MEKVRRGQFPIFVLLIKKSKAFPGITYIFPPISICPELYTWPPLDAREVEKVSPTIEAGKEEGFGE